MLPHNRLCPVPNPHLRTAGNVGVYRLGAEHGRGSPRDRRLGSLPPPRLQFVVPPFRISSAAKYFGKVADDAFTRRGLSRSEDGTGATASMGAAQPGVCVCVFVVVCVWVTGTGRALTRLTVVVQGAIECNTFAGAPVRGGTHSARPFALRRLYLHAVKCSPPNTTKRESFVTATSNRYKSCLLYTSPSPRDGLLSRMPSSA